ncbi:precorrin-3B synthase [Actinoplanes sp. CA-030573]|uniref:precorrin-3B synthase n=1 Tax=Actinoplanes sp. CA-030573 TaxID=3239898 RepID=UPI003D91F08D
MPRPPRVSPTDACPGALRLHAAADGPLARVRLPGGMLTGRQLAELGAVASELGDGGLELTSRANVQLRALTGADPSVLAARLSAAGLLPSATHEVVRNIAAPPLAGPPLRELVRALDRALCADPALAALPGRFLFAIGTVELAADVAALPAADGLAIVFAGHDEGLRVSADRVVAALLAGAHAFLAERAAEAAEAAADSAAERTAESAADSAAERTAESAAAPTTEAAERTAQRAAAVGKAWRLAELPDGPRRVAARVAAALGLPAPPLAASPIPGEVAEAEVGLLPQPDGRLAVGAIVPLGRLTSAQIALLAGADRLVLTPARNVIIPDLSPAEAAAWMTALAAAGLPVEADSRWSGVTACAGRPGCAKSLADIRADALAATRYVDGLPVHWIGCARGCGSPPGPHVRVEATPGGYTVTTPAERHRPPEPDRAAQPDRTVEYTRPTHEALAAVVAAARGVSDAPGV